MKKLYSIVFYLTLLSSPLFAQTIRYVKETATGTGDGSSWVNASNNLQGMIDASASGDQVWVAQGTYKPTLTLVSSSGTADAQRDKSFALKTGVAVYGGFVGSEATLSERNFVANLTVLSGDLGAPSDISDNAYHVVTAYAASANTSLDGFTISDGNANGDSTAVLIQGGTATIVAYRCHGAGINIRGTNLANFANLIIKDNVSKGTGAGFFMYTSSPVLTNVTFQNNKSTNGMGGAMFCRGTSTTTNQCSPSVSNSTFIGNSTDVSSGGAIQLHAYAKPVFNQVVFKENISAKGGGVIYLNGYATSSITAKNCTFLGNRANSGAAGVIYNYDAAGSSFINCKFIGNYASSNGSVFAFGGSSTATITPNITSCIFADNTANGSSYGGVIYNSTFTNGTITNCTFYNNSNTNSSNTNNGGAVAFFASTSTQIGLNIQNSIFNANEGDFYIPATNGNSVLTVKNSLVQTTVAATNGVDGNIVNASPSSLFASTISTDADFLKLAPTSVALDAGLNSLSIEAVDLANNPRIRNTTIDLGAYELQVGNYPLPVNLMSYKAVKNGATAVLNWKTESEQNNQKFVIERGLSATDFSFFKEIAGAGNSNSPLSYSVTDFTPLAGTNYYRLTQVDSDGKSKVLGIEAVTFELSAEKTTIYPNPARSYVWVKPSSSNGIISVNLISLTGQIISTNNYAQAASQQSVKLDLTNIPAGAYMLWVNRGKSNAEKQTLLVVK
ncbi:MAG: T9SS type A sorting domain-containing protein [Flavobacteriales bacterium]|nr:MAG: T9SS type A sorting domain-containing protein [Flavobacteriales bacterium]